MQFIIPYIIFLGIFLWIAVIIMLYNCLLNNTRQNNSNIIINDMIIFEIISQLANESEDENHMYNAV
jgi:hypothetical protein